MESNLPPPTDKERRWSRLLPRRWQGKFTIENDHNPKVQQDCGHCSGLGKHCTEYMVEGSPAVTCAECEHCAGTGVTGRAELYFTNNSAPIAVSMIATRWVTCPTCGRRFTLDDENEWTGLRHKRCGQKLIPQSK